MRKLIAILGTVVFLALAGTAAGARKPPPIPRVPGVWSHVEMNVTIRHVPHTIILDRGRIVQVTTSQITLREQGGVNAVIPVNAQTIVVLGGRRAFVTDLRRRMFATTMRIDGGAAVRVRATSF